MKKYFLHHKWLTTILAISSLFLAIFLSPGIWASEPKQDADTYLNAISAGLGNMRTDSKKTEVIKTFCNAMNNQYIKDGFLDPKVEKIHYAPKYSLFITSLCSGIGEYDIFYKKKLIKGDSREKILGNKIPGCNKEDIDECDLSKLLPALFNSSMNDHSTLSIAGWAMIDDEDEIIKNFSKTYFGDIEKTCLEKGSEYISNKSAAGDKNALCSHPNVYQSVKNVIQSLRTQKNNLRIIQGDAFEKSPKCVNKNENLLECAYVNNSSEDLGQYQYNLWHNELLYYKLLLSRLTENKLLNPNVVPTNLTKDIKIDLSDEIQNLKREEILSENAIELMQKSINNIRATFPLHIGLQVYYEDVVAFRKSLVKVYTPIHQLNYKLRNIQEKK